MRPTPPADHVRHEEKNLQKHVGIQLYLVEKKKEKYHVNNSDRPAPDIRFCRKPNRNGSGYRSKKFDVAHLIAKSAEENFIDTEEFCHQRSIIPVILTKIDWTMNEAQPQVRSYPELIFKIIPLPTWLTILLFWEIIFFADYLIARSSEGALTNSIVFGLLTLSFASICIGTIYCSKVLQNLFSHLSLFIDEPTENLKTYYQKELKMCYEGFFPLASGLICAGVALFSFQSFIVELSPAGSWLLTFRSVYIAIGFFFLGVALWALLYAIKIPNSFIQFKIRVSTHQFAGNGLQALGSAYLRMALSISITFLFIVITTLASPYSVNKIVLIWLAFGALLIFGFFILPQVGIHRIMSNEKSQRMRAFSHHLEEAMDRSLKDPTSENMQRLKELFELQQHLRDMNEWPFNMNSIWQLITALLIPLALTLLEILF
jgi:hypothetical protein